MNCSNMFLSACTRAVQRVTEVVWQSDEERTDRSQLSVFFAETFHRSPDTEKKKLNIRDNY